MRLSIVTILPAFSFLAGAAASEAPKPATPDALTATPEITIDLVVRDKKGRPFRKLQPADLEIKDDGTPVKVKGLRLVAAPEQGPTEPGREERGPRP